MPDSESALPKTPEQTAPRIAAKIAVFLLLFALMVFGLNRWLVPTHGAIPTYFREGDAADVMIIGNSTVYRISAPLVEELTGLQTCNLSSALQTTTAACSLLEEAIARGETPKTLLLYLHIRRLQRENAKYDYNVIRHLTGARKARMLVRAFSLDEWPEALLSCIYVRGSLQDRLGALLPLEFPEEEEDPPLWGPGEYEAIEKRLKRDRKALSPYYGKGFGVAHATLNFIRPDSVYLGDWDLFDPAELNPVALEEIDRITEICQKHDIDLIFFSLPILPGNLLATEGEGYDGFHRYAEALAQRCGVPFWDLTYVRSDVEALDSSFFVDSRHGNASFSLRMTTLLAEMLREHLEGTLDRSRYLYDDYETYLQLHPGIQGLAPARIIETDPEGAQVLTIVPGLGAGVQAEYRVTWLREEEDPLVLLDWTSADPLILKRKLPPGEHLLRIEARQPGSDRIEQTLERTFLRQ